MYSKSYSIEEVYRLIKEKYPQYKDDTIVIRKWKNKPAVTFKELIILMVSLRSTKKVVKIINRNETKLNITMKKLFPSLTDANNSSNWADKLIGSLNLKCCIKCKIIYSKNNFNKNSSNKYGLEYACKSCKHNYYEANKEYINERHKRYYQEHKEYISERNKKYYEANKECYRANKAKYRANKLQRTPKWVTEKELKEIKEFYKNCPEGYHVDHIIPLQGKNVSGLHCLSNLQYLIAEENLSKSNKYTPKLLIKGIDY